TKINIGSMQVRDPANSALVKYQQVAEILCQQSFNNQKAAFSALLETQTQWTEALALPRLSHYGLQAAHLDRVITHCRDSSMRTNPIVLSDEEVRQILLTRL